MKNLIKNKFPLVFNLAKYFYHLTPIYKEKIKSIKEYQNIVSNKRKIEELKVINEIFGGETKVLNGPFKGLKYINTSSGSTLLPKILGSYEEPIQGWIEEVINNKKYSNILDIGCAEGYYACGFAMRMPTTLVTAYDIDPIARESLRKLKTANNLNNIYIKDECTHIELNENCKLNTLIFCDIEGYEDVLLDPIKVPNLVNVDLIIESHDCFVENITETLISRFYMSHTIRIVVDYPFRVKSYETPNKLSNYQLDFITNEMRSPQMKFIYMEKICGTV